VVRYAAVQFVDRAHPADDAAGARSPGSAVIVPCAVITTSDTIWENGPHFTTTDIKTILPPLTPTPTVAVPAGYPPRRPLQLACHRRQHQHALECPVGPDPTRRAAASPTKPLDNLLHLPPGAAPVQEAIDLVEDKPLEAAVFRSDSGRLSVFVRWLSRRPGVATRRVMPLRSRAFSDLRFSPPEHPGTIRGNKDRHSRSANECVCIAGLRVGHKRTHHVPPDLVRAGRPRASSGGRAPGAVRCRWRRQGNGLLAGGTRASFRCPSRSA
jgi:hypothetical protein